MITRCLIRLAPKQLLRGIVVPRGAAKMSSSFLRAAAPSKSAAGVAAAVALCSSSSSLAADGTTATAPGPLGALTSMLLTGDEETDDTVREYADLRERGAALRRCCVAVSLRRRVAALPALLCLRWRVSALNRCRVAAALPRALFNAALSNLPPLPPHPHLLLFVDSNKAAAFAAPRYLIRRWTKTMQLAQITPFPRRQP